jgi:predicted porin
MKGLGTAAASAAVILLSGAGGAFAADLPTKAPVYKAPADDTCTSILDFFTTACLVQAYGVRFYGTIDVGLGYMTNGAPVNRLTNTALNNLPQKQSNGPVAGFMSSALSQSNIGFQVKEPLGAGWSFVGQIEAAYVVNSLELANSPGSLHANIGRTLGTAISSADGSFNGTPWNSLGFAGFSNDTWGTITFGRQYNAERDVFFSYDPVVSQAFSLLGGNGTFAGGGNSEQLRETTSVKYRVNFANFHFGAFAQVGDYSDGNSSKAQIQGDVGADFHVGPGLLSVDAAAGYTKDGVGEALAGFASFPSGVGNPASGPATGITATISNDTSVVVAAKYNVDKLTVYGGYNWIQLANPSDTITGFTDISGFQFGNGSTVLTINNTPIAAGGSDKVLQTAWVGAKYALTPSLDFATGFYYENQNNFNPAVAAGCAANGNQSNAACAGSQYVVSAVLDWKLAPKWDTYIGTMYNKINGSLDNGFLANSQWLAIAGLRFRW